MTDPLSDLLLQLDEQFDNLLVTIQARLESLILDTNEVEQSIVSKIDSALDKQITSAEVLYQNTLDTIRDTTLAYEGAGLHVLEEMGNKALAGVAITSSRSEELLRELTASIKKPLSETLDSVISVAEYVDDIINRFGKDIDHEAYLLERELQDKIESEIATRTDEAVTQAIKEEEGITERLGRAIELAESAAEETFKATGALIEGLVSGKVTEIDDLAAPLLPFLNLIAPLTQAIGDSFKEASENSTKELVDQSIKQQWYYGEGGLGPQSEEIKVMFEKFITGYENQLETGFDINSMPPDQGSVPDVEYLKSAWVGGLPNILAMLGLSLASIVMPIQMQSFEAWHRPRVTAINQRANQELPTLKLSISETISLLRRNWFNRDGDDLEINWPWKAVREDPEKTARLEDQSRRIGFDPFRQDRVIKSTASREWVNGEIDAWNELSRQGVSPGAAQALGSLAEELLPLGEWLRLYNYFSTPTKLDPNESSIHITEEDLNRRLRQEGLSPLSQRLAKLSRFTYPTISDVLRWSVRDIFDPEVVTLYGLDEPMPPLYPEWASKAGIPPDIAEKHWQSHFILPSLQVAAEAQRRRLWDIVDPEVYPNPGETDKNRLDAIWKGLFKAWDIVPKIAPIYERLAYNPIGRVDIRRMDLFGLFSSPEELIEGQEPPPEFLGTSNREKNLLKAYEAVGFDPTNGDAQNQVRYTLARTKATLATKLDPVDKGITRSIADKLLKNDEITNEQYDEILSKMGYSVTAINYFKSLLQLQINEEWEAEDRQTLKDIAKIRPVTKQELERFTAAYNISANGAALLKARLARISSSIVKTPSLALLKSLLLEGLLEVPDYMKHLRDLGYSPSIRRSMLQSAVGIGPGEPDYNAVARELGITFPRTQKVDQQMLTRLFGPGPEDMDEPIQEAELEEDIIEEEII